MRRHLRAALFTLGLLALWETAVRLLHVQPYLLPGPYAVGQALVRLAQRGELVPAVGGTLGRLAAGYVISLIAGLAMGMALAANRRLDEAVGTLLLGLQAIPSVCWLPVAVLWFGLGEAAILFVVIAGAFLAITTTARDGFRSVPPVMPRAGRSLGATGIRLWLRVILPAASPALLTGAKLGWAFAWRSLMAGELLGAGAVGLGQTLTMARELNDLPRVFAVMAVIMALGLLADGLLFAPAERAVARRWGLMH